MAEVWGNITGTLSSQTDLQAELDAKSNGLDYREEATSGQTGWILANNNGRNSNNPIGKYSYRGYGSE